MESRKSTTAWFTVVLGEVELPDAIAGSSLGTGGVVGVEPIDV